ncbi:preprotein translocase subunit SecY [Anaeromyxobacter paludicola]|uniref:Protein translocase subunit SecY n=1 Tax=Anaeromyxobacter paludicola TaxID=2918171 RepID=A0ABN6N2U1_9BACT|nr:preprotein translocase subunit SecY [Anaeromyxobacter paludicola]BDG07517.1 protein translocase subunit SecY [Anaeromyxobacter paludicola]
MITSGLANIFRIAELRKRLLFTLGILAVYRLGIFVTTPGVDRIAMRRVVQSSGGLLGLFNLFSGGALEQLSIFALGIMPYISASIILQLLTVVVPALEKMQKEGEVGRRRITQYTRYGTIVLSVLQGFGIASYLESLRDPSGATVVVEPGWGFRILTVISLAAGTAFIMWMGEQITERGIGNGISLIIFAGIVARVPDAAYQTWAAYRTNGSNFDEFKAIVLAAVMLAVVAVIIFFERGQRRIPIQYAKRVVGRRLYGGQSTHLPLKVNTAGVIPPIFASSILLFPATLASWFPFLSRVSDEIRPGTWVYNVLYVLLIIFFAYFYTAVTFNPVDVADNLKKYGGYVPGIRPGKKTADYIDHVLTRITFGGAIYIAAVCVLPTLLINQFGVPFYFGGTALLIVVGVALDTVQQIEGHLITRHYEGFTGPRGPRIRGRRMAGQAVGA